MEKAQRLMIDIIRKESLLSMKITKKEQPRILYGALLGDSYRRSRYKLEFRHTEKQKEYAMWKISFFKSIGIKCSFKDIGLKQTNYGEFHYYEGRIDISKYNSNIFDIMYDKNNKKIVPKRVIRDIHPIGLMIWFMDDGCLSIHVNKKRPTSISRQAFLNVQGFNRTSIMNIKTGLFEYWGIKTNLHKDRNNLRLYLSAKEFQKFIDIIRPYLKIIPKSMRYKFCMQYKKNSRNNSEELCEKYNLCKSINGCNCNNRNVNQ